MDAAAARPKESLRAIPEMRTASPRIAVIVPCHNEEAAVAQVVSGFKDALPEATIYIYDNASTDRTADTARRAGAVVRAEPLKGKGNVVRRMFADVDADIYVLVDGDATYDPSRAREMIDLLLREQLDMVNAARLPDETKAYRPGHRFGNWMLTSIVALIFGNRIQDMLSGYRVFSRRFVKSFPALAQGFEIETELTVHALELRMPIAEVATKYGARPEGSASKLSTIKDGIRILLTIISLMKEERPLPFFGAFAAAMSIAALVLSYPLLTTYLQTHLVPRFPTAILASAMMLLAFLSLACGFILDTVTRGRRELKRMQYLRYPAPANETA